MSLRLFRSRHVGGTSRADFKPDNPNSRTPKSKPATRLIVRLALIGAIAGGMAACKQMDPAQLALQQPRGASVAFESIDGLPRPQFQTLVETLNDEAQSRRLAVVSRNDKSVYRVKGYLAATVERERTTVAWTWDVFDGDQQRVLQIKGEETGANVSRKADEAWKVADEAMLKRIARTSVDQLSVFLTSPEAAPNMAAASTQVMAADDSSPEAAGIFRIYRANADPLPAETPEAIKTSGAPMPQKRPSASHAARQAAGPALALLEPASGTGQDR